MNDKYVTVTQLTKYIKYIVDNDEKKVYDIVEKRCIR